MEEKIIGETIIKLLNENKEKHINKLIENLKNEGKIYLLKRVVEFLKLKNIKIQGQEPAKLYLAFDYDERKIEEMMKEKFAIRSKIIKKIIDPDLILGGRIITPNHLIDFSFKNLLNKLTLTEKWKI